MNRKAIISVLATGALCFTAAATNAQQAGSMSGSNDQTFAKKAAQGGMAEVKLGQLAQDKGESDTVKNFGKKMVDDHSKANDKLKETASQENLQLPSDLDAHDQATYDKLSQLSGAEFDKAYARDMVNDHVQDIAEFKTEASSGQDRAIKGFAAETLPTLQDHLRMARQMASEVGVTGTRSASSQNMLPSQSQENSDQSQTPPEPPNNR